ncbi:hypothetical protein BC828DRAFT_386512 [Blastocladiella britannica]|nr:hypothetical protein BC828DRAFT_386512 [Blastocladiella britannica]
MTAPTLLTPIADLDADADDSSTLASLVVGTRPWMLRSSTPSPPPPQGSGFHRQHHHHHQSHQPHQSHHHHYHRSSVSVPSAPSPAHRGSMVMPSTTMAMAPATATHPHRASMYIGDSGSYGNTSSNGNGGAALTFSDSPFQRQISAYSAASTSTSPRVGAPGGGHQRRASSQMASSTSRPMSYHASIGAHTAYTAFPPPK